MTPRPLALRAPSTSTETRDINLATTSIHCKHSGLCCVVHLTQDEFCDRTIYPAVRRAAHLIAYLTPRESANIWYEGGENGYSEWGFGEWSLQTIEVVELSGDFKPPTRRQLRGELV